MAHGGSRPGAGRPKGSRSAKPTVRSVAKAAKAAGLSPLDFMLSVMNDEGEDMKLRAQMAVSAAPYVHPKIEATAKGKKERAAEAAADIAAGGKFAPRGAPKLVVNNRG